VTEDIDAVISAYCHCCAAAPGEQHDIHCDVARCTECGNQFISCGCRRGHASVWTGEWPGKAECREFGWYTDPDSPCGVMEDLNRLYASREATWDKEKQRWVLNTPESESSR
jgi:hypothetical protein